MTRLPPGLADTALRALVTLLRRRHARGGAFDACKRILEALSVGAETEGAAVKADTLRSLAPHVAPQKGSSIARVALTAIATLAAGAQPQRLHAAPPPHATPPRACMHARLRARVASRAPAP